MSAIELNTRFANLASEIDEINAETKTLTQKRTEALTRGDQKSSLIIRRELQELQERLEDLTIMKTAVEAKLRVYKGNAQKAADVRKQIAGELWPQGTKALSKMQQALTDLSGAIQEIDQLNHTINGLAAEHETLIGESIRISPIFSLVPQTLRQAATIRLPELPESLELKLQSQLVRENQETMKAAFDLKLAKQKARILPYLESVNRPWPKCKTCSRDLVCVGGSVYNGIQGGPRHESIYNDPELQLKAFRLQFCCEANGSHNGKQGFIRIEDGPIEKVNLTQLNLRE